MSPTHPKPAFVLLHGAWHTPYHFSKLIPLLESQGHKVVALHLPSSGSNPPITTWDPDLEAIRSAVTTLAQEQDVIVVTHSNSGLTGGTALAELDKPTRLASGHRYGVIRLIYICAFLVPENHQQCPTGSTSTLDPDLVLSLSTGTITVSPERVKDLMYQDLSDAEALEMAKTLVPQALGPVWCKTTYAAWRWIPTTYVITLGDKPSTVQAAEWLVSTGMKNKPNKIDKVIRREVGHVPFWTQPEWTAGMLIKEAGRIREE